MFARKRLFGYRLGVAGLLGITLMSWFVWNHHIFPSGIAPGLRPFFMTATEFISIPTSIVYLNFFGTIWRSKLALRLPLLFAGAALINFLIGGLSGVFLSDVPLNMSIHGTYFVIAHFHYTILGGEIFALYAASYYWFPKITGKMLNRKIGVVHLVTAMVFFNTTFVPMFAVGMLGMQRQVPVYIPALQGLNVWITINAYLFGLSNLIWLGNMVYSWMFSPERAVDNPWQSRTLEWQVRTPVPHHNFDRIPTVVGGPYDYDEGEAPAVVEVPPPTPEPVGTA